MSTTNVTSTSASASQTTSLSPRSYSNFMRSLYKVNVDAASAINRKTLKNIDLISADQTALKNLHDKLKALEYSSSNANTMFQDAKAFVETYNNILSSTGESSSSGMKKLSGKIKELTGEYKSKLESVGITIGSSGKLTFDKSKFGSATVSEIKSVFGKDSEYMNKLNSINSKIKSQNRKDSYQEDVIPKNKSSLGIDIRL